MKGPKWDPNQEDLPESEQPSIIRASEGSAKNKMIEIPIDKIDLEQIGAKKASSDDGAAPHCTTRNLPFRTGCALKVQVLLLNRLPEDDEFGNCVATGEMHLIKGGLGRPR